MGLRIIVGIEGGDSNGRAVLYCSTSMRALPWRFENGEQAEAFVELHGEVGGRDFRSLSYEEQEAQIEAFHAALAAEASRERGVAAS